MSKYRYGNNSSAHLNTKVPKTVKSKDYVQEVLRKSFKMSTVRELRKTIQELKDYISIFDTIASNIEGSISQIENTLDELEFES